MRMALVRCAALVVFGLVGARTAEAASVELAAMQDTTLFSSDSGAGNGAGVHLFVGNTLRSAGVRRSLLLFDFSTIPSGSSIDAVTLVMRVDQVSEQSAHTISLHRVLATWGEGTAASQGGQGAAAGSLDATWSRRFFLGGPDWSAAGGDFAASASASTAVDAVGTYQWSSTPMVSDVQSWLDASNPNAGWILIGDEASFGSAKRILSAENVNVDHRPRLIVAYTPPVPEPTVGALMLSGVMVTAWTLRRRRARSR